LFIYLYIYIGVLWIVTVQFCREIFNILQVTATSIIKILYRDSGFL